MYLPTVPVKHHIWIINLNTIPSKKNIKQLKAIDIAGQIIIIALKV